MNLFDQRTHMRKFLSRFLSLSSVTLGALALTACTTHIKDDAAIAGVKRVALVCFSVFEPEPATVGISVGNAKSDPMLDQGSMITGTDPTIDQMYKDLARAFNRNIKWNMMSLDLMLDKPGYQQAYAQTMKGWQNKMPPGQGIKQFLVKQVMDYDSSRILDEKGRAALIDSLGVDAIVVARVDVTLQGTTVMGIGARHPKANLSFYVYEKGKPKPIWFESKIEGDQAESVGKTGFFSEDLLRKYAVKSAYTAFEKIGSTPSK